LLAEPVSGELLVTDAVELPAGVGELSSGQAGIEGAGEVIDSLSALRNGRTCPGRH
jgi:hypothetical protein